MTLRIEKRAEGSATVLRLIGQLRSGEVQGLGQEMGEAYSCLALDLQELNVVDLSGIRFLIQCEALHVALQNCPPYVREWMKQEKGRLNEER